MYADILNVGFSQWIDKSNIVIDEQNGFRPNRSCLEHIYVRYTVINKRKQQKQSTFVCFVDAEKAFDTVHRDCLRYKLMSLCIKGKNSESCSVLSGSSSRCHRVVCGL